MGRRFLIIYPNANEEGVQAIINRIQKELTMFSERIKIDISISIGTAVYPTDGSTLDELIKKADKRMYKVKAVNKKELKNDSFEENS
ncbi:diguanylate cyclase [Ammoniphilus sp. 3BR4]